MSTQPIGGDFTLTTEQIQLVRGAVNAGIEYAARFDDPITAEFDSTRLPHLESASELLGGALDQMAPGGSFTGRMTPSEMRATRMAVGFVESQLTDTRGAVIRQLSINPTDQERAELSDALGGLTPPTDDDVAFNDWRTGVNIDAIANLEPRLPDALRSVRAAASNRDRLKDPDERVQEARKVHQMSPRDCGQAGVAIVDTAVALTAARGREKDGVIRVGSETIDSIGGTDCFYSPFHQKSLKAAWGRAQQAVEQGDELDVILAAQDTVTAWFWNRARVRAVDL